MRKNHKIRVSWKQVKNYITELVYILENSDEIKNCSGIYALSGNDHVLAALLTCKLNLPLLKFPEKNCIIIDDVINNYTFLKDYSDTKYINNYFITSMFLSELQFDCKATDQVEDDFVFFVKKEEDVVIFPWD